MSPPSDGGGPLVDEPGDDASRFSFINGAWGSDGTVIQQTDLALLDDNTPNAIATHSTNLTGLVTVQAEVRLPAANGSPVADNADAAFAFAGVGLVDPADPTVGGVFATVGRIFDGLATQAFIQVMGADQSPGTAVTWALDEWHTLKLVHGADFEIWLDGVLLETFTPSGPLGPLTRVGLFTQSAVADFRNIEATPT